MSQYSAFNVELVDKIAHVQINRPEKINSMNAASVSYTHLTLPTILLV